MGGLREAISSALPGDEKEDELDIGDEVSLSETSDEEDRENGDG